MMKIKTIILIALLFRLLAGTALFAGAERDFGFRLEGGALTGIGTAPVPEIGMYTDFYFLSETFRMTFGAAFLVPTEKTIPLSTIHAIGLEYNVPLTDALSANLGWRYFRAYMLDKKKPFKGNRGNSWYGGIKHKLSPSSDLVVSAGMRAQPLSTITSVSLERETWFITGGLEVYF